MNDKDLEGIAEYFGPISRKIFTVTPNSERATPAELSADSFKKYSDSTAVSSLREAIDLAKAEVSSGGTILITGSLYLAGEAMEVLNVTKIIM